MAKIFYEDVFGKLVECDDEITLLGPNPNLIGTSAESGFSSNFQRIRDPYGDRQRALEREARKTSGYGNGNPAGTVDDDEWRKKFFGDLT